MLHELSIKNFAIIDDLHICFSDGLTILSGETGAGKSIIINAVNLLLGSRADAGLIRTGAEAAELEALFHIRPDSRVAQILNEQGYVPKPELGNEEMPESGNENEQNEKIEVVIRRIISRSDRHRIYLNGHIATLQLLNTITEHLASISGQHAHQLLLKEEHHLMTLDQFGDLTGLRENVQKCFYEIVPIIRELNELKATRARQTERIKDLEFQRQEISDAAIIIGEDALIERELVLLKNSETLYQTVHGCIEELYNAQDAIVERLVEVKKVLEKACQIDPELSSKAKGIMDATFQIEDVAEELRAYLSDIQIDSGKLEQAEERLDMLRKLKRKYGGSLESVMAHLDAIAQELESIENISDEIAETENRLSGHHEQLASLAIRLSEKRKQTANLLAKQVEKELAFLKMSQTRFEILIREIPASDNTDPYLTVENKTITETGIDRATFLISPNVGEALKPLASIASGGELSRVVLALKAILAESESVETIIFDEVDSGIGGGVAEVVGGKLAALANYHQIICITHLAQIAKFGAHHFKISKHVTNGRTRTMIEPLDTEHRVQEIARMLGGITMTQTTLEHALEMLEKVRSE